MSGYENPLVLVTRPKALSEEFVAALTATKPAFRPIIAPAFELEATSAPPIPFAEAVFTSRSGVRFGPPGKGRRAWCVGEATARAARAAGYDPRYSCGNASGLLKMILAEKPVGPLAHFRGETVAHRIAASLAKADIACVESVVYRKAVTGFDTSLSAIIDGEPLILLPVFSAETVSILTTWQIDWARIHVVAISAEVAQASSAFLPVQTTVAAAPSLAEMTQAVARLIA